MRIISPVDHAAEAVEAGVISIILADLGLLRALKTQSPELLFQARTLESRLVNSIHCFSTLVRNYGL